MSSVFALSAITRAGRSGCAVSPSLQDFLKAGERQERVHEESSFSAEFRKRSKSGTRKDLMGVKGKQCL